MHVFRYALCAALLAGSLPAVAYTHSRRGPTAPHSYSKRSKVTVHPLGQQMIDSTRAVQIQSALGRAGYLEGEPTGHWDAATADAMQRFQSDNGWQTKLIPDSRAIIKLGLGPQASAPAPSPVTFAQ